MNADLSNLTFRKRKYVDKQQLLRRLDKAWVAFKDPYAGLSESHVLEPGVTKAWSVRDIIAHVTTWEEEALKHRPAILEGRRPRLYCVTYGGIDAFNALMTTKKPRLSLAEVSRQREEIHRQIIDTVVRTQALRGDGGKRSDKWAPKCGLPVPRRDNARVLCASCKSSIFL